MRLPNGYGSVTKLSGKRRNPYQVKKTVGWDDKGHPKYLIIGYYSTRKEALEKLAEFNTNPYNIEANNYTVEKVWEAFLKNNDLSDVTIKNHKSTYTNYFQDIKNHKYKEIRAYHIEAIMDGKSIPVKLKIKTLFKVLDKTALKLDIINKSYTDLITVSGYEPKTKNVFTSDEINRIYDNRHIQYMEIPLILLYTGIRIGELLNLKVNDIDLDNKIITITHSKTKAGTGRQIPIHHKIYEIIHLKTQNTSDYIYNFQTTSSLNNLFHIALDELNIKHTPHECRHTFRSRLDDLNANKKCIDLLMGHKSKDVGIQVYTHKSIDDLRATIELLQ